MVSSEPTNKYRKTAVFTVASMVILLSAVNSTIIATALPSIERGLDSDLNWTGWVVTSYMLMNVTIMPLIGRISDEWGRKRVFMACVVVFTLGSLFCALSPNIYWLILFRFLQAVGGGGFVPSAYGIVGDHFVEDRAKAIGMFASIFSLGSIIGPALGGWILDTWSWRAIFWINLPVGAAVLLASYFLLERDRPGERTSIDLPGALYFAGALLSVMYFMTRLGQNPAAAASWQNWLWPVLGLAFLLAFMRRESTADSPILEMSLLKSRTFAVINVLNLIYGFSVFGVGSFIPYYAQAVYGISSLASGSLLTAQALGMMGMAAVTSMLLHRTGYRLPMAAGFLLLALCILGLSPYFHAPDFLQGVPLYWRLAGLVFATGVGIGMVSPSSNNAALELMPDKISAITGLRGMFRQSGGVVGVSCIVLTLSFFREPAAGFSVIFAGMGALLLLVIPLIREVPDVRQW